MITRQLIDYDTYSYSYLIADQVSENAVIIDPVMGRAEQYIKLLEQLELNLVFSLETHIHADHVTASGKLRDCTGCQTLVGAQANVDCVSDVFFDGEEIVVGEIKLKALSTPGHTSDSYCFYLQNSENKILFSGDTLLIRGTGRTDFQNGDPAQLYHSLTEKILTLPEETVVYPGHDYNGATVSTIGEEKLYNPRLKVSGKAEFVELLNSLQLAEPKYMNIAVPANLNCGKI